MTGLGYANPYLSPFEEFQRWKTHPNVRYYFENEKGEVTAKRLSYGARAINGRRHQLRCPRPVFPGGALVGCDAGYLNVGRIKGSHAAIKTGMLAAEAAYEAVVAGRQHDELSAYPKALRSKLAAHRAEQGPQLQELVQVRPDHRHADERLRAIACCAATSPGRCTATSPTTPYLKPAAQCKPDRLPQARWQADV